MAYPRMGRSPASSRASCAEEHELAAESVEGGPPWQERLLPEMSLLSGYTSLVVGKKFICIIYHSF